VESSVSSCDPRFASADVALRPLRGARIQSMTGLPASDHRIRGAAIEALGRRRVTAEALAGELQTAGIDLGLVGVERLEDLLDGSSEFVELDDDLREEIVTEQERRWLDDHVPALGGRTPREAALDPIWRDELEWLLDSFGDGPGIMAVARIRKALDL
jgi:hypothetical protein